MMKKIIFILVSLITAAFAGETQLELNQKSHQKRLAAQRNLSQIVSHYKKLINSEYVALFNQSELNWNQYIQSYCKFISQKNEGGSIYPLVYNNCLTNQVIKHTQEISQLFKCQEGALQCVPINKPNTK